MPWKRDPTGWFELWPREPILALSMEEAKAKTGTIVAEVEAGTIDDQFEKRPYQPVVRPVRVKEIEHPTHVAKAVIVRYLDDRFEVGYLVYAPNGRYFPASTPRISTELDWDWGLTWPKGEDGRDLRTVADNLESAEQIAEVELAAIVAKDPEIKRREAVA